MRQRARGGKIEGLRERGGKREAEIKRGGMVSERMRIRESLGKEY